MVTRRQFGIGALAMTGDGLRRPLNAPTGQPPAYGTQPGVSQAVIIANRVIVEGTGGGLFVYSGKPAAGNLIASDTAATIDPFGLNATLPGVTGYTHAGGVFYAVQSGGSGTVAATSYYSASSAAGPYTLIGFIEASGGQLSIISNSGLVLSPGGSAGTVAIFTSANLGGGIPVSQINRATLSVGNSAVATDITSTWTIPAGDGSNGAKYVLETLVVATTGSVTAETLTLGIDLNGGTLVALATLGAAFNGSALNTVYAIPVSLTLVPGAGNSGSDAEIYLSATVGDVSASRLATNSANMSGYSHATAYNPAVSNTVALYAQWGGAGGAGQFVSTNQSSFTRSGQD